MASRALSINHIIIHANQSSIRDSYGRLLLSLGDKVDETRKDVRTLLENVSTKLGGGPMPGVKASTPLNPTQGDFPQVRHWQPEAWNLMRKGVGENMDRDSGVFSAFMEDWFGLPIPAAERADLRRDFYGFFTEIYNKGGTPAKYDDTGFTLREGHRISTEGKFPWLRLCDGHWKYRQTWTHALAKWRENKLPKLEAARRAANLDAAREVIELTSSEDDRPRPRAKKASAVIDTLTSDSSSGAKRGRDNEPATESSKKHKAAGPATSFHPAKPKAKGKQTMRFAQVSVPQPPHLITILTKRT